MKQYFLPLLAAFLLFGIPASAQQQQIVRRAQTPYAFSEFKDATVRQLFGRTIKQKVNISLEDATLRYYQDGKMMVANLDRILGVDFDSVSYVKVEDMLGAVVAKKGYNYLLRVTTIDRVLFDKEVAGTENSSYMQLEGAFIDLHPDEEILPKGFPLKDKYYFWYSGKTVPAIEREFKKIVPAEKKRAFKDLMGDRWWSWKDEASLIQLLDYLP